MFQHQHSLIFGLKLNKYQCTLESGHRILNSSPGVRRPSILYLSWRLSTILDPFYIICAGGNISFLCYPNMGWRNLKLLCDKQAALTIQPGPRPSKASLSDVKTPLDQLLVISERQTIVTSYWCRHWRGPSGDIWWYCPRYLATLVDRCPARCLWWPVTRLVKLHLQQVQ